MEVSVISGASNTESVLVIIWTSLAVLLNAAFSASGEKMPIIIKMAIIPPMIYKWFFLLSQPLTFGSIILYSHLSINNSFYQFIILCINQGCISHWTIHPKSFILVFFI